MSPRQDGSEYGHLATAARKVLLIAYYFPPRQSIASRRLGGVAKFLPESRWMPYVLTPKLPAPADPRLHVVETPYVGDVTRRIKRCLGLAPQRGLQQKFRFPPSVRENRAAAPARVLNTVRSVLVYPDEERGWRRTAVQEGLRIAQGEGCSAIISSSSPVTAHIAARDLKRATGLPWIADLRDLWTQNADYRYGVLRRVWERRLERRVLGMADCLVTVSAPLAEQLSSLHTHSRVVSIPNGYDPDEVSTQGTLDAEFSIVYTGHLYQGRMDPAPLFGALRELLSEGTIDANRTRVHFFGSRPNWLQYAVKEFRLDSVVELHGAVSREEAIRHQRSAQLVLLLNWTDPRQTGIYTGKLFEYLAARRPVLAIGGPKGVVTDLLETTRAGRHVTGVTELKSLLLAWYSDFLRDGKVRYEGIEPELAKYSQRAMAERFAVLLDEVAADTARDGKAGMRVVPGQGG